MQNNLNSGTVQVFHTVILKLDNFVDEHFIYEMSDFILEEEKYKTRTSSHSLLGKNGWHSNNDLSSRNTDLSNKLNEYIRSATNMYMECIGARRKWNKDQISIESWAMVMRSNDWSFPHTHGNSDLSGTFYLQVPKDMPEDQGNFVAIDPRGGARGSKLFGSQITRFKPKVGTMLVFPGWLDHYVEPHEDGLRMSCAWNAKLEL